MRLSSLMSVKPEDGKSAEDIGTVESNGVKVATEVATERKTTGTTRPQTFFPNLHITQYIRHFVKWWSGPELNWRPPRCESNLATFRRPCICRQIADVTALVTLLEIAAFYQNRRQNVEMCCRCAAEIGCAAAPGNRYFSYTSVMTVSTTTHALTAGLAD